MYESQNKPGAMRLCALGPCPGCGREMNYVGTVCSNCARQAGCFSAKVQVEKPWWKFW